jgi:hypothetical protein
MNKLAFIAILGFILVEWLTVSRTMRREGTLFSVTRYWTNYKWGLAWNALATIVTLYFSEFVTRLLQEGLSRIFGEGFVNSTAETALEPLVWFLMGSCGAFLIRHVIMRAEGFLALLVKQPDDQ